MNPKYVMACFAAFWLLCSLLAIYWFSTVSRLARQNPRTTICTALLFCGFFVLYQLTLAVHPTKFPDFWFLGLDSQKKILFFNALPSSWHGRKHPLYVIVATPLYLVAARALYSWVGGVLRENLALVFPGALIGGANIALSYLIFLRKGSNRWVALCFAVLYGLSTATWIFSSYPETYALTALCTNIFLLMLLYGRSDSKSVSILAVANALACYASPQQIFLSVIPGFSYLRSYGWNEGGRKVARYAIVFLLTFVLPYQVWLMTSQFFGHRTDTAIVYLKEYASAGNLLDSEDYARVLLNFTVFSVVGPIVKPASYQDPSPQHESDARFIHLHEATRIYRDPSLTLLL